jgi:hypothetical protein
MRWMGNGIPAKSPCAATRTREHVVNVLQQFRSILISRPARGVVRVGRPLRRKRRIAGAIVRAPIGGTKNTGTQGKLQLLMDDRRA